MVDGNWQPRLRSVRGFLRRRRVMRHVPTAFSSFVAGGKMAEGRGGGLAGILLAAAAAKKPENPPHK